MDDLQKLLPGFPGVNPQAPFLQVAPNVNFMHNLLPMQNLQPTGQLEYKVTGHGGGLVPEETNLSFL
jgi:serine/threonine-protein kinase SIK3